MGQCAPDGAAGEAAGGRGMGASRAIRVFSKKLLRCSGAVLGGDSGWSASGVDCRPRTCRGPAGRGCDGGHGGMLFGRVRGLQRGRAGPRRFDGCLPNPAGWVCRDGDVGAGANVRAGNTSRRSRNRIRGRCRTRRATGIGNRDRIARLTQPVYTIRKQVRVTRQAHRSGKGRPGAG